MDKFESYLFDEKFRENLWKRSFKLTRNEDNAQDLVQDTFLKALEKKDNFLSNYSNDEQFESLDVERWVYTVCRNLFLDKMRKKTELLAGDDLPELSTHGDQEEAMVEKDLRYCLDTLREDEREIISLVQESSYADISEIMAISQGNVRVKVHRARESLANCMGLAA